MSGERGFHIFSYLCYGASTATRAKLHLPATADGATNTFGALIGRADCGAEEDPARFSALEAALTSMGISAQE